MKIFFFFFTSNFIMSTHAFVLLYFIFRTMRLDNGLFKINLEMAIFEYDLENEISVCVKNWQLKTWVLKSRFENSDSWLLSKKAIIN